MHPAAVEDLYSRRVVGWAMGTSLASRLVKRKLHAAGLPTHLSPHNFRVSPADVQYLLGHSDPRTTRLYDRRQQVVMRSLVERISV